MELDGNDGNATFKSDLSPSVGEQESHSRDGPSELNGTVETDTEDEENSRPKKENIEALPENNIANGYGSHSEDETEVADNDTTSNIELSNQLCSGSSPSSLLEIECDPIDTLKG